MKVFVDMDGVLADFDGACTNPRDENGDPPEMFQEGFFRNLKVLPGAREGITALLKIPGVRVMIASKPCTQTDFCLSEKMGWLREHFPELVRTVHFVVDKNNLKGHHLIDDDKRWKNYGGNFIHFDTPNSEKEWKRIVEYLTKQVGE